jgi:hypothetical protein
MVSKLTISSVFIVLRIELFIVIIPILSTKDKVEIGIFSFI